MNKLGKTVKFNRPHKPALNYPHDLLKSYVLTFKSKITKSKAAGVPVVQTQNAGWSAFRRLHIDFSTWLCVI